MTHTHIYIYIYIYIYNGILYSVWFVNSPRCWHRYYMFSWSLVKIWLWVVPLMGFEPMHVFQSQLCKQSALLSELSRLRPLEHHTITQSILHDPIGMCCYTCLVTYVYIYIYIYINIYTHIHRHIYIDTYIHIYAYIHIYT